MKGKLPFKECAADDMTTDDGRVYDTDRTMFLRAYLTQLQHTNPDGVPVKGNFQWGTMDNCEWTAGFGNRFRFVYVDFSRKNIPKLSVARFSDAAVRNAVA